MNKQILKTLETANPGDLICCSWCDASVGKSSNNGGIIDVPVRSWGVLIGLFGEKTKHIVIAQNSFQYADGLYDLDYTAIPLGWTVEIGVLMKGYCPEYVAANMVNSFLQKDRKTFTMSNRPRTLFQRRLSTHGRPN